MLPVDIAGHLHQLGIGVWSPNAEGGSIFVDELPPSPHDCIYVRDTNGAQSLSSLPFDTLGFQIIVRGQDVEEIEARARRVYNALHGLKHQLIGETRVNLITATAPPANIGWDESRRVSYSVNFRAEIFNPRTEV